MKRILVVDDDPTFGSTLESTFQANGLSVDVAASVAGATLLVQQADPPFDAYVVDLVLSDGHGLPLLELIRERGGGHTPVIVVSSYLPDYMRELMAFFADVKLVVPKPVDPMLLARVVTALLGDTERGRRSHA